MKVCKKCKNEYKEDYIYCPKCGQPYDDNMKKVKTPESISGGTESTLKLIWNIILYIFGGFTIFGSLLTIFEDPISSIVGILFGLSLFQFIYKIIEDKTMIDSKYLKIARIVIPIVLLITIGLVYKGDGQTTNNMNNNQQTNQNTQQQTNNQQNEQQTSNQDNNVENNNTNDNTTTQATPTQPSEPAYMEYLRKCTVMEAYDIITTGVGNKSGNPYVDAKKTCETFYSSFGEKDFIDAVSTDWNSEQTNTIDGKPLTDCIKDLGW